MRAQRLDVVRRADAGKAGADDENVYVFGRHGMELISAPAHSSGMTPREPMLIEVWSDIACPFCYIGKRRLQGALARFPHRDDIRVQWRSFQLQPQLVTDASRRINEYLASAKGMPMAQVEQMQAHVAAMGASEGITFAMDRVVVANTFAAHRVLQFAQHQGRGDAMKDRLLQAYFTEGANVDDAATLAALAADAGLARADVAAMLAGDAFADEVRRDLAEARQLRIGGVPFFLFDRAYAISGAQPPELFDQALARAHGEWRAATRAGAP
jgi:predicted DsbA family dithiol-disulfide isomerase